MALSHGRSGTKLHKVWWSMINRCERPSVKDYANYGGRGITVCERWRMDFMNFRADMGEPLPGRTLERRDNDKNYTPENCKWVLRKEQSRNKRNNVMLTAHGKTMCMTDWATELGIEHSAIIYRLRAGWSVERAVTEPKPERPNAKLTMADAEAIRSGFGELSAKELARMYDITDTQIYNVINFKVFKPSSWSE